MRTSHPVRQPESSGRESVQFPLSVFFELTALVSVIFLAAGITGWTAAICLCAMAFSILYRLGIESVVCFAFALFSISPEFAFPGIVVCIAEGILIASWPRLHAWASKELSH